MGDYNYWGDPFVRPVLDELLNNLDGWGSARIVDANTGLDSGAILHRLHRDGWVSIDDEPGPDGAVFRLTQVSREFPK